MSQNIPDYTREIPDAKWVGASRFKRNKPNNSPPFEIKRFHHLEFYCGDATSTMNYFSNGLGMKLVSKSDHSTGNHKYCSYVLQSNDIVFVCTAPYFERAPIPTSAKTPPHPHFDQAHANDFFRRHGLAVKAIGVMVDDCNKAYNHAMNNGGISIMKPTVIGEGDDSVTISELSAYLQGDVVIRFISYNNRKFDTLFLPGYQDVSKETPDINYGLQIMDHCVGNVDSAMPVYAYLSKILGLYKFAEFIAEDVGTPESGLQSVVCSSMNEMILLPLNEPTHGTKRVSQIQTYLDHNDGPGVQHIALKSDDILSTVAEMRKYIKFQKAPPKVYYEEHVPKKMGDKVSKELIQKCSELGILIDTEDGEGTLLQIFTEPLGDRPTFFIEIIERLGCVDEDTGKQAVGCGGFGRQNFGYLFSILEKSFSQKGLDTATNVKM